SFHVPNSADDSVTPVDLFEGSGRSLEVLALARGGNLYANAGLALRSERVAETDHINAFSHQVRRPSGGNTRVEEHDEDYWMDTRAVVEARVGDFLAEIACIRLEPVAQRRLVAEHLQYGDGRVDDDRRDRIREEVGPRSLAQQVDDLLAPR